MSELVFREVLESKDFEIVETKVFIYSLVWGVKFEFHERKNLIVIGYGNSDNDRDKIYDGIQNALDDYTFISYKKNNSYIRLDFDEILENVFEKVVLDCVEYFRSISKSLEKPMGNINKVDRIGATFEGTIFENLKERGATMSPMFGRMVCDSSGMNLERMLCEYYIPGGRLDGVELDEENNIVSIYECASGIHKGQFLDWDHWNKVLCRYMYSKAVFSDHLKRVVILAAGYDQEMIKLWKNINKVLKSSGIELVLLTTVKHNNKISITKLKNCEQ